MRLKTDASNVFMTLLLSALRKMQSDAIRAPCK